MSARLLVIPIVEAPLGHPIGRTVTEHMIRELDGTAGRGTTALDTQGLAWFGVCYIEVMKMIWLLELTE